MPATAPGIVSLVVGLVVCFFGYRLFRFLLPLAGLVYGYAFGASLVPPGQWLTAVIIGAAVAVVCGVLSWFAWSAAVVVGGALLGFGFGWALGTTFFLTGPVPIIVAVILAVIFAILFAVLRKPALIVSTAGAGAAAAVYGLGLFVPFFGLRGKPNVFAIAAIIILAVVGFIVQFRAFKDRELYKDIGY
jgi:hypothetical protein